jgi:hypothetical protein
VPTADAEAMTSIASRLMAVLEREPTLRGGELDAAVAEKERLVEALEQGLQLAEAGAEDRVKALGALLKPLAQANLQAFKFNRILLQLSKIGVPKPKPKTVSARRVDLIS